MIKSIKQLIKELKIDDSNMDSVYLNEIALLMEEKEQLKGKVREQEKIIKDYLLKNGGKKDE